MLGLDFKPAPASEWQVLLEYARPWFNDLVGGAPALQLDPSMVMTAEAPASRIVSKESRSGLEVIRSEDIAKPHPWHDCVA